MKSFKAEVRADDSLKWYSNQLRFATEQEALRYARDLMSRWTAVREYRVVRSDDPITEKAKETLI